MVSPLLQLSDVTKAYPGVRALDEVSFSIGYGETLGFIGENGAGKSTLMNILCGIQQPDSGTYRLHGHEQQFIQPNMATRAGVFRVHQEQALITEYPVYKNLFLGLESHFSKMGIMQFGKMKSRAAKVLSELGVGIDAGARTASLNFGTRQIIEIARVIAQSELLEIEHPLVLLDEPTASISGSELDIFYKVVDLLSRKFNASILFVSHRLEEVIRISDRILVLKDGKVVADDISECTEKDLHRLMVGRERIADFYAGERQRIDFGAPVLKINDLGSDSFDGIDLQVREGEIVGIGGLVQSGKTELGLAILGMLKTTGTIEILGQNVESISTARRIGLGVGYVPLHRHSEGVLLGRSIADNIVLPSLKRFERVGVLNWSALRSFARDSSAQFRVKAESIDTVVGNLSGGNQQKIVLSKWLARNLSLLVVDNPTRGVDAGAKEEIYDVLRTFASNGGAILMISDDLVELIELSNRVLFLSNGTLSGNIDTPKDDKPAEQDIVHLMF